MTKARDAALVQAWQIYEGKKRAWAAGGYDPEKQPRFFWHPRQGATFRIPSGKVTSFVKIKLPPHHQVSVSPHIGSRQPRRCAAASSDGGEDGADPDPDPERSCAVAGDDSRTARWLCNDGPRTTTEGRGSFVARAIALHKPAAQPCLGCAAWHR